MMFTRNEVEGILAKDLFRRKIRGLSSLIASAAITNKSVNCFVELFSLKNAYGVPVFVESFSLEAACYAGLPNKSEVPGALPLAVVVGLQKEAFETLSRELIEEYFNWLAGESPFSEAVYDYAIGESSGSLAVKSTVDARVAVGALIAARTPHEFPEVILRWEKIRGLGFNKRAAFLLAHLFDEESGKLVKGKTYQTHTVFDTNNMDKEGVLSFIKGEVKGEAKDFWEPKASYRGITNLWKKGCPEVRDLLPTMIVRHMYKIDKGYYVDRWGFPNKNIALSPTELCKALGIDEKEMLLKDVNKQKDRKVSARTLRERAYKEFIIKRGIWLLDDSTYLKHLRKAWLKAHPLSLFLGENV